MNPISELFHEIRNISSGKRNLRNFGILFLVVLGGIGLYFAISRRDLFPETLSMIFFGAGALIGFLGFVLPVVLKPLYIVWMALAIVLGFIVSRIILIVVYYLILTPTGLLMRLFGKDILDKKKSNAETFWNKRDSEKYDPARTDRMF